jgi:hypothetical protein
MIFEVVFNLFIILVVFSLFMNVLRIIIKKITRKNSDEISWYILANLVFEKESLKKMDKLIKEMNKKSLNFSQFDYKKYEIRKFLEIPLILNTTHWIGEYYGVKELSLLEKNFKVNYYEITKNIFPLFWENEVQYEMFEDLDFLKEKILCLQPERKDELEYRIKLTKLSRTFDSKN